MKDKKCKTKECKNLINSKMSKSGLCNRCLTRKYREEHKRELKAYSKDYRERFKIENPEEYKKRRKVMSDWWKKFSKENPEHIKKYSSDYYDEHKEEYKNHSKKYYEENKEAKLEYTRLYQNKRYREDEGFRMRKKLGGALWKVINCYIKTGKILNPCKKYGIDWKGIIKVLSPIPKDRHKYHVDHIIELSKFDLTNIEQIQIAFAPKNHRWMLAKDNLRRARKE